MNHKDIVKAMIDAVVVMKSEMYMPEFDVLVVNAGCQKCTGGNLVAALYELVLLHPELDQEYLDKIVNDLWVNWIDLPRDTEW